MHQRWIVLALAAFFVALFPLSGVQASVPVRTVATFSGPQLPEGVVLDHQGNIYLSMVLSGEIIKIAPDGTQSVLATLDPESGFLVALAIDNQGNLYAALASHNPATHGLWRISPDGTKELIAAIPDTTGLPNQVLLGKKGNIYVSDSHLGVIWRVTKDGQVDVWLDHAYLKPKTASDNPCNHTALPLPVGVNGIAFDKRGDLYFANEDRGLIGRVTIDPRTGEAGTPEIVVQNCDALKGLDQIAFDVKGNLYAAINTQNKLVRITPAGQIETLATAADGLAFPANITFGTGPRAAGTEPGNRKQLYFTNLAFLGGQPSLQVLEVGIPGQPLP